MDDYFMQLTNKCSETRTDVNDRRVLQRVNAISLRYAVQSNYAWALRRIPYIYPFCFFEGHLESCRQPGKLKKKSVNSPGGIANL